MRKVFLALCLLFSIHKASAWGREGHQMIARMAFDILSPGAKAEVTKYLSGITVEDAGTWMDNLRDDKRYDYMKPWHYINLERGKPYVPSTEENIINEILQAMRELKHKETLCPEQIKTDLLVLFHLIGDIHQPLHTDNYEKGGNGVKVTFMGKETNLHSLWDSRLIEQQGISLLNLQAVNAGLSTETKERIRKAPVEVWLEQTHAFLSQVYGFSGNVITEEYATNHRAILTSQLVAASIRLSATLESLFGSAPLGKEERVTIPETKQPAIYAAPMTPEEAAKHTGETVTVCGKVYEVSITSKVSYVNLGAKYPQSPLTLIIFDADKKSFKKSLYTLKEKTVCVTGIVKDYKGKAEIIVNREDQIKIQ